MKRLITYFAYFLFWVLFFIAARAVFLLYHLPLTETLSVTEIFETFLYGLRMDVSFASYICVIPFILYLVKTIKPEFRVRKIIKVYSIILIVILSFLVAADLELYTAWGFRMDATPLIYMKNPEEMKASVSSAPIFILIVIFLFLSGSFIYLLKFFNRRLMKKLRKPTFGRVALAVVLVGFMLVPIRGGIQKISLNISDVYFSDKMFANHAAINLPWNIMFSVLHRDSEENPYTYFSDSNKAERTVDSLYNTGPLRTRQVIDTTRPDLIFIILESFTAKWVGCLGGVPGVTPQLDAIAADGLLFKNIYATGDRSEKGQVGVLSGYPNQAISSIVKIPLKTRTLPSLAKALDPFGYTSSYTHGGELGFANIKSYLVTTGYKHILTKYSFPISQRTTSWGVHDQYVFDRFYEDLKKEQHPFFATIFSLSSHEPFDVPDKHFKDIRTVEDQYKNSVYYTDSVLGDFIRKIRKEAFWDNTLVVIVADHGQAMPGNDPADVPSKFHIPLVFTGGALKAKGVYDIYGSQTDIATTVLHQMHLPSDEFKWGKDLLDSSARSFAFYNFNNGFGWVTPEGYASVDNVSGRIIRQSPGFDTSQLRYGKAYMQLSYLDYLNRGTEF
ncbi:MAG: sulfatase-like hydrolase/transferase [Chitinophagaceae bacterium]|nr:sulfatase-like hydrolase/transferase [Chitinophagaceae bacterium]